MGTVIQLKNQINNSYFQLRDYVENKLLLVEEKIKSKLLSDVELVQKMTDYHIDTGGKRLRAINLRFCQNVWLYKRYKRHKFSSMR